MGTALWIRGLHPLYLHNHSFLQNYFAVLMRYLSMNCPDKPSSLPP